MQEEDEDEFSDAAVSVSIPVLGYPIVILNREKIMLDV